QRFAFSPTLSRCPSATAGVTPMPRRDDDDDEDYEPRRRRRERDDEDEDDEDYDPRPPRRSERNNDAGLILGIVGLVFGTMTLLFSFIPCLGVLAFWPGIVAALISALGLFVSVRSRAIPATALVFSL